MTPLKAIWAHKANTLYTLLPLQQPGKVYMMRVINGVVCDIFVSETTAHYWQREDLNSRPEKKHYINCLEF